MTTTIIARNTTAGHIDINDLGLTIAPSEVINLTEIFMKSEILESLDLKPHVENGDIVINDGNIDLSQVAGIMHIRVETEYEDLFEAPAAEGELPVTSIRRNTNFPISTTPTPISYNQLIDQNAIGIIEWTSNESTRIYLKQAGLYEILITSEKQLTIDVNVTFDIRLNGILINESIFTTTNNNAYEAIDNISYIARLSNAGYIEVYIHGNHSNGNIIKCNVHVVKLQGAKGDKGDAGIGSTIDVMDGITTYPTIDTVNFMNFSVSVNSPGRADVIYDPTSLFKEAAVCQIRNSNSLSLPTSYTDLNFDLTDTQNATDTILHSVTDIDRIIIKKSGLYFVVFVGEFTGTSAQFTHIYVRIRKNDSTQINGGLGHGHFYRTETHDINMFTYIYLEENDFLSVQVYSDDDTTLSANNRLSVVKCDAIKGEDGAPGLSGGDDLASIQLRNSIAASPASSSTWNDITFNNVDIETHPAYMEHDGSNANRILIKSPGTYQINYTGNIEDGLIEGRIRINDATVINGSYQKTELSSSDLDILSSNCIIVLSGNEYLTFQLRGNTSASLNDLTLTIVKLEGAKGEKGDAGGSDVDVEHNDSLVSENVNILNFEGNVTVTNEPTKTTIEIGSGSSNAIKIFQAYDIDGGTNLNSTTPYAVPLGGEIIKDDYYSHSNSSNNSRVTILHAGWYKVSYNIAIDNQSSSSRKTTRCFARLSGSTEIMNSVSYSYTRNSTDTRTSVTATFFTYFNLNEYIEIMGERDGSSGDADTIEDECWMLMEFIKE